MSTSPEKAATPYLFALPLPDVVHTTAPMLPLPEPAGAGVCFCCGLKVSHRFVLAESLPLAQLTEAAEDTLNRLTRAEDILQRLTGASPASTASAQEKHRQALKAARTGLQHAALAARRLALRHIATADITETTPPTEEERTALRSLIAPFQLCYFCHAWHALNGYAAAQGAMVWLPDLHPRNVVALNRRALQACLSGTPGDVREGKKVLAELLRHRLPVEERFGSWRPADFADALRRTPPSKRGELRANMEGIALILTPDSVTDKTCVH